MESAIRIAHEYDRLVALGSDRVAEWSIAERIVFYVVSTRCEIDINGFVSVYEQHLNSAELKELINGLQRIGEVELAANFRHGLKLLKADGFYEHMNWDNVLPAIRTEIDSIGERIGQRLWGLDAKLAALLDDGDSAAETTIAACIPRTSSGYPRAA
jgi:hypothetical protein